MKEINMELFPIEENTTKYVNRNQVVIYWNFFKVVSIYYVKKWIFWLAMVLVFGIEGLLFLFPETDPEIWEISGAEKNFHSEFRYNTLEQLYYYYNGYYAPKDEINTKAFEKMFVYNHTFLLDSINKFKPLVESEYYAHGVNIKNTSKNKYQVKIYAQNEYAGAMDNLYALLFKHLKTEQVDCNLQTGFMAYKNLNIFCICGIALMMVSSTTVILVILFIYEMITYRENRLFLLMTISGAYERTIWLSFFTFNIGVLVLVEIAQTRMMMGSNLVGETSFGVLLLTNILGTLSLYTFALVFVIILKRTVYLFYVSIFLLAVSYIIPTIGTLLNFKNTENIAMGLFVPLFSPTIVYQNIDFQQMMNRTLTFSSKPIEMFGMSLGDLLGTMTFCAVFYFLVFIFLDLMMPRSAGSPPIGWRNMFSLAHWKRLFVTEKIVVPYDEDINLLDVEGISKTYKGRVKVEALKNVEFSVSRAEIITLIGPNGCGKSTLLNSMTGVIEADSGKVRIYGKRYSTGFAALQDCVGICFQDNVVFPFLSVKDHLEFFGRIRGATEQQIKNDIDVIASDLSMTGILNKKAATLSGGEKRKLCISIAFIGSPPLVILDEPTAGIDVNSRAIIWKTISRFNKTACFVTSHSLEEAETVSSRIFVMRAGEIIYQGTPSELRRKYNCGYRITSLGDISREEMMRFCREKNIDSSADPDRADSILIPVSDTVPDILSELYSVSQNIVVTVESLEHVILRMISEEEGG